MALDVGKTDIFKELADLLWLGKGPDGFMQVLIGLSIIGDEMAQKGDPTAKISFVKAFDYRMYRDGHFENGDLASDFEYPPHFAKGPKDICDVTESVGDGDTVEGLV